MPSSSFRLTGGVPAPAATVVVLTVAVVLVVMLPQVSAIRYIVGQPNGWASSVNFTVWAQGKHFYNGDWLFFVYDRNQLNVLEVNKTDYEACNSDHPIHNWTTGAGRDVVPLNITKDYYFISGKGFCFGGVKLAVHVENPPPPPSSSPHKSAAVSVTQPRFLGGRVFMASMFAAGAAWDLFLLLW